METAFCWSRLSLTTPRQPKPLLRMWEVGANLGDCSSLAEELLLGFAASGVSKSATETHVSVQ